MCAAHSLIQNSKFIIQNCRQPRLCCLCRHIDTLLIAIGRWAAWSALLLMGVILLQVVMRYGFGNGLVALEELQWHLYAIGVMFGLSYAQALDAQVRVDPIYGRLSPGAKRWIEVIGILLLALPFVLVVFIHSLDFVADAWRTSERSSAPLGLPARWLIKAVIPVSFGLLGLALVNRLLAELGGCRSDDARTGRSDGD